MLVTSSHQPLTLNMDASSLHSSNAKKRKYPYEDDVCTKTKRTIDIELIKALSVTTMDVDLVPHHHVIGTQDESSIGRLDALTLSHILDLLHPFDVMALLKSGNASMRYKIHTQWSSFIYCTKSANYRMNATTIRTDLFAPLTNLRTLKVTATRFVQLYCFPSNNMLPPTLTSLTLHGVSFVFAEEQDAIEFVAYLPCLINLELKRIVIVDAKSDLDGHEWTPENWYNSFMRIIRDMASSPVLRSLKIHVTRIRGNTPMSQLRLSNSIETLSLQNFYIGQDDQLPSSLTSLSLRSCRCAKQIQLPASLVNLKLFSLDIWSIVSCLESALQLQVLNMRSCDLISLLHPGHSEFARALLALDRLTDLDVIVAEPLLDIPFASMKSLKRVSDTFARFPDCISAFVEKGIDFSLPVGFSHRPFSPNYLLGRLLEPNNEFYPTAIKQLIVYNQLPQPTLQMDGLEYLYLILGQPSISTSLCLSLQMQMPKSLTELEVQITETCKLFRMHADIDNLLPCLKRIALSCNGVTTNDRIVEWIAGMPKRLTHMAIRIVANPGVDRSWLAPSKHSPLKLAKLNLPPGLTSLSLDINYLIFELPEMLEDDGSFSDAENPCYPVGLEKLKLRCMKLAQPLSDANILAFPKSMRDVQCRTNRPEDNQYLLLSKVAVDFKASCTRYRHGKSLQYE